MRKYGISGLACLGILSLGLGLLTGCTAIPKAPLNSGRQVPVGPGTEDLIMDPESPMPRILISCDDRRNDSTGWSGIVAYQAGNIDTMPRKEEPKGMVFHPHGLDIANIFGRLQLYVVCHDDKAQRHWIACYQVVKDELFWIRNYESPLLRSPNAVCAMPDGSLYVTNDHYTRGSFKETFFKQKVAEIVHFTREGEAKLAYKGFAYANGITQRNGYVYVAATTGNAIYRMLPKADGTLGEPSRILKLKCPDNLRWDGNDLIVACHLRPLKFIGHAKNPKKHSPTVVYQVDLMQGTARALFADRSGKSISAGATGLKVWGQLYIGGVFDNWIIEAGQ